VEYKTFLPILIGSENDEKFIDEGIEFLKMCHVPHQVIVLSVHRSSRTAGDRVMEILRRYDVSVIIAGAATATGLPGFVAGCTLKRIVLGVRFTKEPGQCIFEDATFNLSSMPKCVPLAYTGYNEKGFYHACVVAKRIIEAMEKLEGGELL
jgi:phosphoribosylcarboxyaminoimidazole (NCAIR) mutase